MYNVREAHEEDRESVVQVLTRALGEVETFEEYWIDAWRNFWYKPEFDDWAYVATHNDRVVANLSFFVNPGLN